MKDPVPILVCGNAGPVGGDLLRRRDIAIHWALNIVEALAVITKVSPKVCIVLEQHARDLLDARPKDVPTQLIVLMPGQDWPEAQTLIDRGATVLVPMSASERILEAVGELTGLEFAKQPRVDYRSPVEIDPPDGPPLRLETVNLSASGVAVRGLGPESQGKTVGLRLTSLEPTLEANAVVVRCFELDGAPMAGLCFTDLSEEDHGRIARLVEKELSARPESMTTMVALEFGAEIPVDEAPRRPGDVAMAELKAHLREVHLESKRDEMLHQPKRPSVPATPAKRRPDLDESKLSHHERASMRGDPAPAWAEPALKARIQIDLDRRERGKLTAQSVHEVLVVCRDMGGQVSEGDLGSLVEITQTRAALLKEIYWEPAKRRVGTKARL